MGLALATLPPIAPTCPTPRAPPPTSRTSARARGEGSREGARTRTSGVGGGGAAPCRPSHLRVISESSPSHGPKSSALRAPDRVDRPAVRPAAACVQAEPGPARAAGPQLSRCRLVRVYCPSLLSESIIRVYCPSLLPKSIVRVFPSRASVSPARPGLVRQSPGAGSGLGRARRAAAHVADLGAGEPLELRHDRLVVVRPAARRAARRVGRRRARRAREREGERQRGGEDGVK